MLHTFLVVLSIIGIIIACILGILLLLAILILFLSIRYNIYASYHNNEYNVSVKVKWLFGALGYRIEIEKDYFSNHFTIFGIRKKKKSEKKKRTKKKRTKDYEFQESEELSKDIIFAPIDEKQKIVEAPAGGRKSINSKTSTNTAKKKTIKTGKIKKGKSIKIRLKEKINSIFTKIKAILNKSKEFYDFLTDKANKEVFFFLKEQLFKVLRHIKPRKIKGNITFGFEDPSITGRVLGAIAVLFIVLDKSIQITPDFEKSVFEGDIIIKGRLRVLNLLVIAWKCYRNKKVKKAFKGLTSLKN